MSQDPPKNAAATVFTKGQYKVASSIPNFANYARAPKNTIAPSGAIASKWQGTVLFSKASYDPLGRPRVKTLKN